MGKIDDMLESVWILQKPLFQKVEKAVAELLNGLVTRAVKNGVPLKVATDTYIDWLRSHMREESFMS